MDLQINHPYIFKIAMTIALEVTHTRLSRDQTERMNQFLTTISGDIHSASFLISEELCKDLAGIISYFNQSTTWTWLREDLRDELENTVNQLKQKC